MPALGVALGLFGGRPVLAEPSVEDVKAAGEQFNLGRTAFKDEDYTVAAEHFERADGLAPNAKVLLLALQARMQAGQLDRAAMLAELALRRHSGDERFAEARDVIARAENKYARVEVSCDEPCNMVVGMRLVHGAASTTWVLFLEEGDHSIRAGFGEQDTTQEYTARQGETGSLAFVSPSAGTPFEDPTAVTTDPAEEEEEFDPIYDQFKSEPLDERPAPAPEAGAGLSPTWFWIGAGTTVALAGVSTWSGLDTLSNPGPDAVREQCRGQGESCQLYRDGVGRQDRTNLLWGITAGVGVVTGVLFVLTDWGGDEATPEGDYSEDLAFSPLLDARGTVGARARGRF